MTIGHRIRDTRIKQGISQETLAELAAVSRQTISKWENGAAYPSGENLAALSGIFGLPVEALINDGWTPPPEPEPVIVEVPVEVPVPRPRNYRLGALLAAVVLTVGILMGALFFQEQRENFMSESEMESEVIDTTIQMLLSTRKTINILTLICQKYF